MWLQYYLAIFSLLAWLSLRCFFYWLVFIIKVMWRQITLVSRRNWNLLSRKKWKKTQLSQKCAKNRPRNAEKHFLGIFINKIKNLVICANLIWLCGCYEIKYEYVCPFGVGYLTKNDYETMQDGNLISDEFATWLLSTNQYCEAHNGSISL